MTDQVLAVVILFVLTFFCPSTSNANRVRDIPNSQNGQLDPEADICVSQSQFSLAFVSGMLTDSPISLTGIDSTGAPFTVTITARDFGQWLCVNGQPRIGSQLAYTFLEVVVTATGTETPPILNSFIVAATLANPRYLFFSESFLGFMPYYTSSPYLLDQFGDFQYIAQPSPVTGADGDNTVWSFGLITDPDTERLLACRLPMGQIAHRQQVPVDGRQC